MPTSSLVWAEQETRERPQRKENVKEVTGCVTLSTRAPLGRLALRPDLLFPRAEDTSHAHLGVRCATCSFDTRCDAAVAGYGLRSNTDWANNSECVCRDKRFLKISSGKFGAK